jgi:1-acyl-sn-glycerol-3-phosphate acyltransferase
MIYSILRWISGIAVHWFYGEIRITDRDKIPDRGPLFIAVNHQNALVDSLITAWVVKRRVTMTAKATLTTNPFVAWLFRALGVVPLRRAGDEVSRAGAICADRSRNEHAFREILGILESQGAVLIFPEGKSHNQPGLEPLKSGLARLALSAKYEQGISNVMILPLGLVFEDKGRPGSVVGVRVGEVIAMDTWASQDHVTLTREIAQRLRKVSAEAEMPSAVPRRNGEQGHYRSKFMNALISVAAFWGRITHELPVRAARHIATSRSRDADQPAMLTIGTGTALVLLSYAVNFVIVDALVHSVWISALYVASLLVGAYWTAFKDHPLPG